MEFFLNTAGKKLFEQNVAQYTPQDALYETYTDDKGKEKRRKRLIPPGLSAKDAKILRSVQKRAHYLDKGFRICGVRFGWTFVIGFIPVAGDITDAALNYYLVLRKARQADLPNWLVQKMLFNNIVSASVGFVPIVGDVILATYKANSRNAALLEEFLRIRGSEGLGGPQGQVLSKEDAAVKGGNSTAGSKRLAHANTRADKSTSQAPALPGSFPASASSAMSPISPSSSSGAGLEKKGSLFSWKGPKKGQSGGTSGTEMSTVGGTQ